jgi:hypothetical protein
MEFVSLFSELQDCAIAEIEIDQVKRSVTVVSRRMVREEKIRNQTLERVRRHRNASVTQMKRVRYQKSEVRSHIREEKKNAPALPAWLPLKAWEEYKEHRKLKRAKMTSLAAKKCVDKLDELRRGGHDPAAVLNQSIQNGWTGIFPTKGPIVVPNGGNGMQTPVRKPTVSRSDPVLTEAQRRENIARLKEIVAGIGK